MRGAGDSKGPSHQHRAPRDLCLINCGERAHTVTNRTRLLSFRTDQEAWNVSQMHDRQMKSLGEVKEPDHFHGTVGRPAPAVEIGVAREHSDGPPVKPREAR